MRYGLRLFLLAFGVVALVVTALLFSSGQRLAAIDQRRLDARLCQEVRRLGLEPERLADHQRLLPDLLDKLHLRQPSQLRLRTDHGDAQPLGPLPAADELRWDSPPADRPNTPRPQCRYSDWQEPSTATAQGQRWRLARLRDDADPAPRHTLLLAADADALSAETRQELRDTLLLNLPLAVLLSALGAALLATLTMRPIHRLRRAMRELTPRGLQQPLPDHGEAPEFRELIAAYNTMLARLDASFAQASRFSADAAHELKTPLTILRGQLEQATLRAAERGDSDDQQRLAGLLDEVSRLTAITRKLLLLAQADAGNLALQCAPLDGSALLHELADDTELLLGERHLTVDIAPALPLYGDTLLLRQLLHNLLGNAARYSPPDGWLRLSARHSSEAGQPRIEICIRNNCQPIPASERQHFFARFYRGDPARTRRIEGSGLGLSLARELARAHGGELTLAASPEDEVCFVLHLPTPD